MILIGRYDRQDGSWDRTVSLVATAEKNKQKKQDQKEKFKCAYSILQDQIDHGTPPLQRGKVSVLRISEMR